MNPDLLKLVTPKNRDEFHAIWEALNQYVDNHDGEPGPFRQAAEDLIERYDYAAMKSALGEHA